MNGEKQDNARVDFVMIEDFDRQKYAQYASLSASQRKSLPSTNFWLQKTGRPLIPVPPEDRYYRHYFREVSQVSYVNTPFSKRKAAAPSEQTED